MKILLNGGAGFIGSTASERLLKDGYELVVLDNFCDFYDPKLKEENVKIVEEVAKKYNGSYELVRGDIRDDKLVDELFKKHKFDCVIHWAAMAGVRPSIENPKLYEDVNIHGLVNVLEAMKNNNCHKMVFISSSSVYGNNKKVPFSEKDNVDNPISPYAATKKAGELICYTYHKLFNVDTACLRYFTVYGPRQRPDLAINKFTRLMLNNEPIPMFGDGTTARDYTYVDDIVHGTILSMEYILKNSDVYEIFNLGGSNPISLKDMINLIAKELKATPKIDQLPMQAGDVDITYSDYSHAKEVLGYEPKVKFEEGIHNFVEWYKSKQ